MLNATHAHLVVLLLGSALAAGCRLPPGVDRFSEDDMTPPVLESSPPLEPPPGAAASGQEGVVELECIITKAGNPEACRIEHDLPGGLGQAVLQMVQQQHYAPALREGKPVAVLITLPFLVRRPLPLDEASAPDVEAKPKTSTGASARARKNGTGTHTRAPKVRMGVTTVHGFMPPEIIQRVVRANFGYFRVCYEYGLSKNPNLRGRVTTGFVIGRSGYVTEAAIVDAESDLPHALVRSCVRRTFFGFTFPRPREQIIVKYPITFAPG